MKKSLILLAALLTVTLARPGTPLWGQEESAGEPQKLSLDDNTCLVCHTDSDLWEGDTLHLYVDLKKLANDVHWKKGLQCQDCHGGNPETTDLRQGTLSKTGSAKSNRRLTSRSSAGIAIRTPNT